MVRGNRKQFVLLAILLVGGLLTTPFLIIRRGAPPRPHIHTQRQRHLEDHRSPGLPIHTTPTTPSSHAQREGKSRGHSSRATNVKSKVGTDSSFPEASCRYYEEEDAHQREGDPYTHKVTLHPRLYFEDNNTDGGCGSLGGWHHDIELARSTFTTTGAPPASSLTPSHPRAHQQQHCDLTRYDINHLTLDDFRRSIEGKRPAIFVDPTGRRSFLEVRAFLRSLHREELLRSMGKEIVRPKNQRESGAVGGGKLYTVADYIHMMDRPWKKGSAQPGDTDYITGNYAIWNNDKSVPAPIKALISGAPFLAGDLMGPEDERRVRLFVLGAAGSGAAFHRHETAWSHQFFGIKRWFVRPPSVRTPVLVPPEAAYRNTTLQWLFDTGPHGYAAMRSADKARKTLLECVQMPGETFYLPPMWWHATVNVAQSVSFAQFDLW